jgi:hypothetical protein
VRRGASRWFAALSGVVLSAGCGSRSEPERPRYGAPLEGGLLTGCVADLDCGPKNLCAIARCENGACVTAPPVDCDDGDPCTTDACAPSTGACSHTPVTPDEDGDGYRAPLPGFLPGAPGSCGDDCNDASAAAHPGAKEICDGVDNDCNGIVDDGVTYTPSGQAPVLLSTGSRQASAGGIRFGTSTFATTFAADHLSWENTFSAVDPPGTVAVPATAITHENTDSFTGPLVFTGSIFGTVWEDRRDGDYEIYFNRLDEKGGKLAKDVRVTDAPNFSLLPDLIWDGVEFVIVWDDLRDGDSSAVVFAQRIDHDGNLLGANVPLTDKSLDANGPRLAKGATNLGVTFNKVAGSGDHGFAFAPVSADLATVGTPVVLTTEQTSSTAIVWNTDRYVVVWDTSGATPGPVIHGAAVSADGTVLVADRPVTAVAPFARSESLLPLGDRLLLVWAEERTGSYALYSKTLNPDLTDASAEQQMTDGPSDSLDPDIAFGPNGVGVLFEDRRSGSFQVYYDRLDCGGGGGP